jgi:hypothetical protein
MFEVLPPLHIHEDINCTGSGLWTSSSRLLQGVLGLNLLSYTSIRCILNILTLKLFRKICVASYSAEDCPWEKDVAKSNVG